MRYLRSKMIHLVYISEHVWNRRMRKRKNKFVLCLFCSSSKLIRCRKEILLDLYQSRRIKSSFGYSRRNRQVSQSHGYFILTNRFFQCSTHVFVFFQINVFSSVLNESNARVFHSKATSDYLFFSLQTNRVLTDQYFFFI